MSRAGTNLEVCAWVDRLAIQDVIEGYSDAVTRADWAQCEGLFAPDASWESPAVGLRYDSAAAFLDVLGKTSTSDLLIQTTHSSVIKLISSDEAQATSTVHELTRGPGADDSAYGARGAEINFEQYGIHFDDIARITGEWKFTHRLFVPIYVDGGCITGHVMTPRSGLLRMQ
jgi:hypothetical protein